MRMDQIDIDSIVSEVVKTLQTNTTPEPKTAPAAPSAPGAAARCDLPTGPFSGTFATVDEAVSAASAAQKQLLALGIEKRKEIIEAIRQCGLKWQVPLAELAVEETGIGRVEDKIAKNRTCAMFTPGVEDLEREIRIDRGPYGMTITERIPFGVICAVTPVTNPTSTIFNNGIMFIAGGNAAVFCPHPAAQRCTLTTMSLVNDAVVAAGGPANLLASVSEPSLRTVKETMEHRGTHIICATGGPALVKAALESTKRAVCAGPGNPPVVVDETADIARAARDIVQGAGTDNNVICIAEKEIIVVNDMADDLIRELQKAGAFYVQGVSEIHRLVQHCMPDGHPNKDCIGRDARVILERVGIHTAGDPRIAFFEAERDHVMVMEEQMMPIIPLVRARNFDDAVQIALTAEDNRHHTFVLHSRHTEHITRFINAAKPTIFVVNGPCTAGDGDKGEGHLAMTLAGPTGEGFTRPSTFTRERRYALAGGTLSTELR